MSEIFLLLRPRIESLTKNKPVLALGMIAFLGIVVLSGFGYTNLLFFVRSDPRAAPFLNDFLPSILLGVQVGLFSLVIYTNFSGQKFTGADDLVLLLASPIKIWKVFAAKFVSLLLFPLIIGLTFVLPLAVGMVFGLGKPIWFYPFYLVLFVGFLLVPYMLASLVTITVSFSVGKPRLKEIGFLLSTLLTLLFIAPNLFQPLAPIFSLFSNSFFNFFFPTGWVAKAFLTDNFFLALFWTLLFIAFTYLVIFVSFILTTRLYFSGLTQSGGKRTKALEVRKFRISSSSPTFALFKKDLVTMIRNPQEFLRLAPAIFIIFIGVFHFEGTIKLFGSDYPGDIPFLNLLFIFVVPLAVLSLVSREGKGIWVLRSTPLTGYSFIKAKILFAVFILLIQILFLAAVLAFKLNFNLLALLTILIPTSLITLTLTILNLGWGALFPRFDWENPQQQVKTLVAVFAVIFNLALLYSELFFFILVPPSIRVFTIVLGVVIGIALPIILINLSARKYNGLQIS